MESSEPHARSGGRVSLQHAKTACHTLVLLAVTHALLPPGRAEVFPLVRWSMFRWAPPLGDGQTLNVKRIYLRLKDAQGTDLLLDAHTLLRKTGVTWPNGDKLAVDAVTEPGRLGQLLALLRHRTRLDIRVVEVWEHRYVARLDRFPPITYDAPAERVLVGSLSD